MMQKAIHRLAKNKNLNFEITKEVVDEIMSGNVIQAQISSFLTALRVKEEAIDKTTACATVMRDGVTRLSLLSPVMDIVGAGGDEVGAFNTFIISAFVVVVGGIRVMGHGNRSAFGKSGVADVLGRLGAELALTVQQAETTLEDTGMCFLFASVYHSSVRYATPARKEIGIRSIFNILGPLSNPAEAPMQLLGVHSRDLMELLAQMLVDLGVTRGVVVCEGDGLDEVTLTGPTHVCEIRYGKITAYDMTPEELGLAVCSLEELIGSTSEENAKIIRNILSGSLKEPRRGAVVLNVAISLCLGTDNCTVRDCIRTAQGIADSGAAVAKMEEFIQATKKAAGGVRAS